MKRHKAFTEAVLLSSYFSPNGVESLAEVLKRFNDPFSTVTMYAHCNRHMKPAIKRWFAVNGLAEKSQAMKKADRAKELIAETMDVVEAPVSTGQSYEQGLDEFIEAGRRKLEAGNLPITATTFIQAIKAKAEIENKTKDRRFDAMKTLFAGMGPKDEAVQDVPQISPEG